MSVEFQRELVAKWQVNLWKASKEGLDDLLQLLRVLEWLIRVPDRWFRLEGLLLTLMRLFLLQWWLKS